MSSPQILSESSTTQIIRLTIDYDLLIDIKIAIIDTINICSSDRLYANSFLAIFTDSSSSMFLIR